MCGMVGAPSMQVESLGDKASMLYNSLNCIIELYKWTFCFSDIEGLFEI